MFINNHLQALQQEDNPAAQWAALRGNIVERVQKAMGSRQGDEPKGGDTVCIRESIHGDIVVRELKYGQEDDPIFAYLLVHREIIESTGQQFPAVLAMHQTSEAAKDEAAGFAGDRNLAYGLELAEKKYVVLVPDCLSTGARVLPGHGPFETASFYTQQPYWSMIGKMAADHSAGLDVLIGLPFVDDTKIAAIGHSLGGYNALFLAALDERIQAVVCSCGLSPLQDDPNPGRWGWRRDWFTHFPLSADDVASGLLGFEMEEVAALIAPRGLFLWSAYDDHIFPHAAAIGQATRNVSMLYEKHGVGNHYKGLIGGGGHAFPSEIRTMAYAWLKEQLYRE